MDLIGTTWQTSPLGGRSVDLNGSTAGAISQTLSTIVGKQYQILFNYSGNFSNGETVKDVRVSADGTSQDFSLTAPAGWSTTNMLFTGRSLTFTATSATTTLMFQSLDAAGGANGPVIADVRVIEIPQAVNSLLSADPMLRYDAATGKFYRMVSSNLNFTNAQATAITTQLNGVSGQLVTIGSSYENDLVWGMARSLGGNVWLGASDANVEGTWNWSVGTNTGGNFWITSAGTPLQAGYYANWAAGEPNDSGGAEDYASMAATSGQWNDVLGTNPRSYIVEWDASEVLSNLRYSLSDSAGGRFAINAHTGEITVADSTLLDSYTSSSYSITAQVTDAAGNTYFEVMSIGTTPVNDGPTLNSGAGNVTTVVSANDDWARASVRQADGKILVAGTTNNGSNTDFALVRYNVDGSLDTSFGTGGIVTTAIGTGADDAWAVTLQTDGKILVAGSAVVGSSVDFAVVRYNTNGSLDTTFNGTGIATFDVGASTSDDARSIAVQADGKIVIAGTSASQAAILRLGSNGSLDTTFDSDGKVVTDLGVGADFIQTAAVLDDGSVIIGGSTNNDFVLAKYTSTGTLDTSFGSGGITITAVTAGGDFATDLVVLSDGKIILGGYGGFGALATSHDFIVARYTASGVLDTTFASGVGFVRTDLGNGMDFLLDVAVQSDGKIVAVGSNSAGQAAVVRYTSAGALDSTFGTSGVVSTGLGGNTGASEAIVRPDGRIYLASYATGSNKDFGLIALRSDGSIETQIGTQSGSLGGTLAYTENGSAIVMDSNVEVYDAELTAANSFSGATLTLSRNGGASSEDVFSGTGTLSALTQGGNLVVGGTVIGTVTTNSGGNLVLTFNGNATNALVNQAMRQIGYSNASDAPSATAIITWTFSDGNAGGQGSGGALQALGSVTVNITAVNDAPVLDNSGTMTLTTINEDQNANAGQTVASIIASAGGDRITDPDAGAVEGIAITTIVSGNGTWEYSTNGGSGWLAVDSVANNSALLLRSTDWLRFVPDTQNGTTGSITFRAWDQTTGSAGTKVDTSSNGGTTAFSSATEIAQITVTSVNDNPLASTDSGTATEAGGVSNGTAGSNATGNVLTNDTDIDTGDTRSVSGVAAGVQASAAGSVGVSVSGLYGAINIGSAGAFTYTIDNSNATVQALAFERSNTHGCLYVYDPGRRRIDVHDSSDRHDSGRER